MSRFKMSPQKKYEIKFVFFQCLIFSLGIGFLVYLYRFLMNLEVFINNGIFARKTIISYFNEYYFYFYHSLIFTIPLTLINHLVISNIYKINFQLLILLIFISILISISISTLLYRMGYDFLLNEYIPFCILFQCLLFIYLKWYKKQNQ